MFMLASRNTLIFSMEHLTPKQQAKLNLKLLNAAERGNLQEVVLLLDQGVDVNCANCIDWTALLNAAEVEQ